VKVPDAVPDELLPILGPLGCGIQTGAGAVLNSLDLHTGDTLVIAGAGGVGLSALLAARLGGAGQVIVVDVVQERLETAMQLGASATINGREEDLEERMLELTDGGADLALDTTANMRVIRQLVRGCRSRATIGVLGGSQPGTELTLDYRDFYLQGRTLTGIIQGDAVPHDFIPRLIDAHLQGLFPFDRLIRRYAFDDLNSAIADSVDGIAVKAVATFEQVTS
jgi:aryl-alcohol dehydrogenase